MLGEEDGESRAGGAAAFSMPAEEVDTRQRYEELCSSLNMDERVRCEAWLSYQNMKRNFTLEGNDLHWLACALYVACRKAVPTVSKGTAEGNYVSLTRILCCSEQSLIEFFNKMKKWEDMANLPAQFRERTERTERNFTISAVIFKKYKPIFQDIFRYPQDQPRQQRGRKQNKAINKAYEEYVLSVGNLDERIFLGEDADEEIGTLTSCLNTTLGMETKSTSDT